MKFQPGDQVVCLKSIHGNETVGKIYTVSRERRNDNRFYVEHDDNGFMNCYEIVNFQLLHQEPFYS